MKTLLIKTFITLAALFFLASCTTCGEKGGPIAQTSRRAVDTFNEWGSIASPRSQWRPAYGWTNCDYLLHCCDQQPAPAKWCRLETP